MAGLVVRTAQLVWSCSRAQEAPDSYLAKIAKSKHRTISLEKLQGIDVNKKGGIRNVLFGGKGHGAREQSGELGFALGLEKELETVFGL